MVLFDSPYPVPSVASSATEPATSDSAAAQARMPAPPALLERLKGVAGMELDRRRLVLLWPQLGDFDSLEYAQALVPALPQLEAAGIGVLAIGIGNEASRQQFCAFTGFTLDQLQVDTEPQLHRALGLYEGFGKAGGPWPNLLLMCAGVGSPGTLAEVLRGYTGDRSAPQRIADDETIKAGPLPPFGDLSSNGQGVRGFSALLSWPRCACAT